MKEARDINTAWYNRLIEHFLVENTKENTCDKSDSVVFLLYCVLPYIRLIFGFNLKVRTLYNKHFNWFEYSQFKEK
jgi:hypothetical protein